MFYGQLLNYINTLNTNIPINFLIQIVNPSETDSTTVLYDVLRSFCLSVCQIIYSLFSFFYQLFILISQSKLMEVSKIYEISNRISILLGLIMLFFSMFYLIRLLLDPDKIGDKELGLGNLLKKIIVCILLLGFTPTIFNLAMDIQRVVLKENIIPKIILAEEVSSTGDDLEMSGREIEAKLFTSFFKKAENLTSDECVFYEFIEKEIERNGTFEIATECVTKKAKTIYEVSNEEKTVYAIEYNHIISVIVGAAMLYLIIVYTIDVGIRNIQFIFLQIISPIPIISYILPQKDSMLNRWTKQVTTTYLDIFIRTAVIYFVIYMSRLILNDTSLEFYIDVSGVDNSKIQWIKVILVIALFMFAQRLPKLLQELSGKQSAASIGFGLKNGFLSGVAKVGAGFVAGATLGAVGSTGWGRLTSGITGAFRGGAAGLSKGNFGQNFARARQSIQTSNLRDDWLKAQGYNLPRRLQARAIMASGGISSPELIAMQAQADDKVKQLVDDDDNVKYAKGLETQFLNYGGDYTKFATEVIDPSGRGTGEYEIRDMAGNLYWSTARGDNRNNLWAAVHTNMLGTARQDAINDRSNGGLQAAISEQVRLSRRSKVRGNHVQDPNSFRWNIFNEDMKRTKSHMILHPIGHGFKGPPPMR